MAATAAHIHRDLHYKIKASWNFATALDFRSVKASTQPHVTMPVEWATLPTKKTICEGQ